jgi:hypothetical protein
MEMNMRTLRRPASSNRLRTAKPKSPPKETLSEKLTQKTQARAEIWGSIKNVSDRVKEQREKALLFRRTLDMPVHSARRAKIVDIIEEYDALADLFENHVAALREYFSADEEMDRERDPKIEPVIAKSIEAQREQAVASR